MLARLSVMYPEVIAEIRPRIATERTVSEIKSSIRPKPSSFFGTSRIGQPPMTANLGPAILMRTLWDQLIAWFPGNEPLTPRTRYHHAPGSSGSSADVANVRFRPSARHG